MIVENKEKIIAERNKSQDKRIKINWGKQGGIFLAYIIVLLGYYGIVANFTMYQAENAWLSFTEMDRTVLFWTFNAYEKTFFLPLLLLFFTCFFMTYREDIPHYGIKASIWLVPLIIAEAFVLYTIMFGFSLEPLIFQFGDGRGYLHILILFATTLIGALTGMKTKQFIISKRKI